MKIAFGFIASVITIELYIGFSRLDIVRIRCSLLSVVTPRKEYFMLGYNNYKAFEVVKVLISGAIWWNIEETKLENKEGKFFRNESPWYLNINKNKKQKFVSRIISWNNHRFPADSKGVFAFVFCIQKTTSISKLFEGTSRMQLKFSPWYPRRRCRSK